ncbi:GFA family protein [Kineobactrum salinum]|uniref:CENP-V/GFA domain-containing protein n=1 Tax=Kineobactrum salinum TaxID=2708301 RepID=A0A6C0U443_9GAMM|nr:GFA family protein [Kineobactrum salinum]QIB66881.1 hypothetical protein G3T16_17285 [Kineobactrum salinum]
MESFESQHCPCACGKSVVIVKALPRMRYYCHCLTCQEFCQSPFSDNTALRAEEVEIVDESTIEFKKHQKNAVVDRGVCKHCRSPVVGFALLLPGVKAAFVPGSHYPNQAALPNPNRHIFCHRRVKDVPDSLTKHSGAFFSQAVMVPKMMLSMLRKPGANAA